MDLKYQSRFRAPGRGVAGSAAIERTSYVPLFSVSPAGVPFRPRSGSCSQVAMLFLSTKEHRRAFAARFIVEARRGERLFPNPERSLPPRLLPPLFVQTRSRLVPIPGFGELRGAHLL
jgi:hypothetical protein